MAGGCALGGGGHGEAASTGETGVTATVGEPSPTPVLRLPTARGIRVPKGFRAQFYARGLEHPTAMAFGPGGALYVTEDVGRLVRVRPGARRPHTVAKGFPVPLGLAWMGHRLFVSTQGKLVRLRFAGGKVVSRRAIVSGLPFGRHQQDNVVVGPDGRLYFGSGSTCDACVEADPRSATVLSVKPSGRGLRVVSRGLRNPYGLTFQPGTGRLYVSVNGQDNLPDPNAPEPAEMVVVAEQGRDFGWPDCWPSSEEHRMKGDCAGVTRPSAYLEEHSSADGIAFARGRSFPPRFRGNLFVALWGQYDSETHGRRIVRIVLGPNGRATKVARFVTGLPHPLALAVDPLGALLVADWQRGAIYRVQADGAP